MRQVVGLLGMAVALNTGCGYLRSGTWEDDPGNWKRAFGSEKPAQYVVLHSRYWRAPHFTYEARYHFEIQANPDFKRELFSRNKLIALSPNQVAEAKRDYLDGAPAWFCPKAASLYEAWVYEEPPRGNFKVLIDKETGTVYLTDFQV